MAVYLSPLFTHTAVHEAGGNAELAAELASTAISATVHRPVLVKSNETIVML
jgi:hypothetical protein